MDIRRAASEDALILAELNDTVHRLHVECAPDRYRPTPASGGR